MEGKTTPSDTNVDVSRGKHYASPDDSETFYVKLNELLDSSSGLNLVFNVRETSLDLYLFYLEVTLRGGFHQVGQQKKWGEVVAALKLEGNNAKLSAQVEKLYANLLYKFEKLYFYRFPSTQAVTTGSTKGAGNQKPAVLLQASSNDKEVKKRRGVPIGQSGYHLFLKQECARLKAYHQDIDSTKVLRMAVDAWKKMSDIEKQPYLEESKKIKEKNKEAMVIDNKQKCTQDLKRDEKMPSVCADYSVTSQPLPNYSFVNNAAVDLAFKTAEKTSKDPLFAVDLGAIVP